MTNETLWCVNINGPDDIVSVPDYLSAVRMANTFNAWWLDLKTKKPITDNDARMWAEPIEWPYSEGHGDDVTDPNNEYQWLRELTAATSTAAPVERLDILERVSKYPHGTYFGKNVPEGTEVVARSQAEAIIAAERSENEALKAGIKRLSDEQELLSETADVDLISVVKLSARLSEAEAANAELTAQLAKTESHVEAVKNTLGVRCTDVSFLEERCKMLENELSAPAGYRVIPKQPTDTMLEVMAFNLCGEFGGEFTIANKAFAMAVYKQAWELGIKSESKPSRSARAFEQAAQFIDKRASNYVQEHGVKDPETGTVEFPGWGDEYVSELEELAEDIRTLSHQSVAEQSAAESDVLSERRRQVEVEGWKPEHDDQHTDFSLAHAAAVYALCAAVDSSDRSVMDNFQNVDTVPHPIRKLWPWNQNWLKPTSRRRDLVKAGALIKAEIERLDRVELPIELGGGKR